MKTDISVVIPALNEAASLRELHAALVSALKPLKKSYEIIIVDDGSTDDTWKVLEELHKKDKNLKAIKFKRRFQKAAALSAGFELAQGEIIITMDADLQDDPVEIPRFLNALNYCDLIVGWKYPRRDPLTKIIPSRIFNFLVKFLTGTRLHDTDNNFRAFRRTLLPHINVYGGLFRYIPVLAKAKGFKVGEIKVRHNPRRYGKSKWGVDRLFKGFFDLLTVKFLTSYLQRPLHIFGGMGLVSSALGFLLGFYLVYVKYIQHQLIGNRPLLFLSILLIILGAQFLFMGLLGELIVSKTHVRGSEYLIEKVLN